MEWSIGEFAERVGVSPRTLRHWEHEGLLPRPPRSRGGYRMYASEHLLRLLEIKLLRQAGLSVPEIRACLAGASRREIIRLHALRLREQISTQQKLCRRLEDLAERLDEAGEETVLQALEETRLLPPELRPGADRLDRLRHEVGLHPVVLMRGMQGLEEHLATLSEFLLPPEQKETLLGQVRELRRLGAEMGRDPSVRAMALRKLQERLGVGSPEAALERLKAHCDGEPADRPTRGRRATP